MPKDDDEPKLWVTVVKLVLIAATFIGGTGYLLYYFEGTTTPTAPSSGMDWGIANDSPIRSQR